MVTLDGGGERGGEEEEEEDEGESDTARLVFRDSPQVSIEEQPPPPTWCGKFNNEHKNSTISEDLVSLVPEDEDSVTLVTERDADDDHHIINKRFSLLSGPTLRLLLPRLSLFAVGAVFLVLGGVASRYHPHRPLSDYCECDDSRSWNGTGEWMCGNETSSSSAEFENSTIFPDPSLTVLGLAPTSYLMPTSSPYHSP